MIDNLIILKILFLVFLVLEIIAYLLYIPILKKQQINQMIRLDGPQKHLIKSGTPTMGGALFGLFIIISYFFVLLIMDEEIVTPNNFIILFSIIGFGLLGFIDDYLIVIKKNNKGINPTKKFLIQLLISLTIYGSLIISGHQSIVNFFGYKINLSFVYGIFILFYFVGTTNAVNLTDGLDGLAGGTTLIILSSATIFANYKNILSLVILGVISIAGILGFMIFNLHPAKIFMGNTGSMVLGALLASFFLVLKSEFLLVIMGFILVVETLSDIIQVSYFKLTKGKRILKMAPFHHHLELSGYEEWQIDLIFWSFTLAISLIGIIIGVRLF